MNVTRLIPAVVFIAIFVAHALYVSACAASAPSGWTDFGISAHVAGPLGLGAYWRGQDYFIGFSYALAAAFATWALSRSILFRQGRTVNRRRRGDAFGSAHGRRLFSDRLLWITDASRLPEPVRRQSLGLRQTLNGLGDSGFRQLWLLVPFAPSRAGKHLHGRLLLWVRHLHWGSRTLTDSKLRWATILLRAYLV